MGEGCCPNPKIYKLRVKGAQVGLVAMEPAFRKVKEMGLRNADEIKGEILREIKIYNYVPESAESEYAEALYREYAHFQNDRQN